MSQKIIFPVFAVVYFFSFSAFALNCQNPQLLTDIIACRDDDISGSIRAVDRYEQDFAAAVESCQSKDCLRRLYKQKANALQDLSPAREAQIQEANMLTPDRAGVRELVSDKKLEPLDSGLYKKIANNEIFVFPYKTHNPEYEQRGIIKPFHFRYQSTCRGGIMDLGCRNFLMLAPFESLPEGLGGAVAIDLFVPKDIPAPQNPGHSEIFYLDKTLAELGYADTDLCQNSEDIFTAVLCSDSNLQRQKKAGDKELEQALNTITDKDEAYDLARHDFKMQQETRQCPTISCIEKKYAERIRYLREGEYKKDAQSTSLPQNCVVPELPDEYELYGITAYGSNRAAEIKLNNHSTTVKQRVWINRPEKNVVLVLSSYEPTVWDLHITPQTRLAAVFAGSGSDQMLRGLPPETFASFECKIDYQEDGQKLKYKIRDLGLPSAAAQIMENKTVIGERLPDAEYHFADGTKGGGMPIKLLSGKYGMEQYVERGYVLLLERSEAYHLRQQGVEIVSSVDNPQAFAEDLTGRSLVVCPELPKKYDCRMKNFLVCPAVPKQYECRNKSYLLLEAVDKLPDGLTGNDAVRLYIPRGLPVPENLGESRVYMLNQTLDEMKKSDYFKTVWKRFED